MSTYEEDLDAIKIDQKRMAKFFRVAIHCHSPLSADWGKGGKGDKNLNSKDNFMPQGKEGDFLRALLTQGHLDLITVTDHMKCEYAERLVEHANSRGLPVVLPGMEINFQTNPALANVRIHILVILPSGCTRETFARLLPGISEEGRRKDNDMIIRQDLREWVKQVHALDGICIAAHVESTNGIRLCFRQTARSVMALFPEETEKKAEGEKIVDRELRELIFDAGFDAVEVKKPEDRHYYRWEENTGKRRLIATVLGLDAHCIEDYGRKDQITLVKMTALGINGLRNALKFPETRIRFKSDIKEPPSPSLVGITISGGESSFFEDLKCAFSENLNCIIGPRGSGKSTLVEAIRYVFGYNRTLSELDVTNKLSERIKELQRANLNGALIRLYYRRKDGEIRILEATYDPKQEYTTRVFDSDGKGVPVGDVEASGDYPLRLYGWSEIETLGREQGRQRALLDRMIPNLKGSLDQREGIRDKLRQNRESIRSKILLLQQLLQKNSGEISRFSEYKKDFEELNQPAVRECFQEIDLLEAKKNICGTVSSNISNFIQNIEALEPINFLSGVEKIISKSGSELVEWWQKEQLREREIIKSEQFVAEELAKIKQSLRQLHTSVTAKADGFKEELEREYEKLRNVLSGQPNQQRIADLRRNAKSRLDRVSLVRDEYLERWKEMRILIEERCRIGEELKRSQNEVTGVRATMIDGVQRRLNQFMGDSLRISIKMSPARDTAQFTEKLRDFLKVPGKRMSSKLGSAFPVKYNPVDFANLMLRRDWEKLVGKYDLEGQEIEIDGDDVGRLTESKDWYEHRADADVDVLLDEGTRLLNILELQEVTWDDKEAILLNDQPVDKLSPGQRSSAMLPLIALAENSPLIIDQPEDNLDNRLVGHVLVDILAELKEHRQIIVCTHNPNIVVSGDAEQVIALDAKTDRKGELDVVGSIDNDDIIRIVIELMEGGEEAFRVRRERYGL